ncbi:MAG: hypothetical protein JWR03_2606 [Cohnella sp.]|nr:hypothetical protein [Cohnella sp.]
MANPQTENGFLQIANEIWNEVIRRDFSKRQKDIILFIWRLSYGCKKKTAYVPMLKDFELCGVGYSNITKELKYLVEMRVISWDREPCIFSVNKDYERWQVSPVRGWDEERFKVLLHQNIEKKAYQNDKPIPINRSPKAVVTYQNNKLSLIKTINMYLSKREVTPDKIPFRCKVERVSKERFKEIFKKITTTATGEIVDPQTMHEAYTHVFSGGTMPPIFSNYLIPIMRQLGEKYVVELILETGEMAKTPSLRYMQSIHDGWLSRGVRSRNQAKTNKVAGIQPPIPSFTRRQQEINGLDQIIEEEKRREQSRSC